MPTPASDAKPAPRVNASGRKPCGQAFLETLSNARQQNKSDAKATEAEAPARKAEATATNKSSRPKKPRKRERAEDVAAAAAPVEAGPEVEEAPATEKPLVADETEAAGGAEDVDVAPKPEANQPQRDASETTTSAQVAAQAAAGAEAVGGRPPEPAAAEPAVAGTVAADEAGAIALSALTDAEDETSSVPAAAHGAKALPRHPRAPQGDADASGDGSQPKQQGAEHAEPAAALAQVSEGFAEDAAGLGGEADAAGPATPQAAVATAGDASPLTSTQPGEVTRSGDASKHVAAAPPPAPAPTPERFAELNHSRIVTAARAELLPNGGTMQIKLDPPELGALQVTVRMVDGSVTASFQTSNDEATRLLSHSLAQLKHVLESQGVTVDKIHVQQAPRDQQAANDNDQRQQQQNQQWDESARHEQQRKEMLRRMWRRLSIGSDPLDLVA